MVCVPTHTECENEINETQRRGDDRTSPHGRGEAVPYEARKEARVETHEETHKETHGETHRETHKEITRRSGCDRQEITG